MITRLQIKNYALIQQLDIEPNSGFNTITGETGAGKSIMLGAVGLLLGKRADTKVLYDDSSKCVVEGSFDVSNYNLKSIFQQYDLDYEVETIIRREISASGKSRAFINDVPVTLDILKNISNRLVDIHSQHETLLLADNVFQLNLIDAYAQTHIQHADYQQAFREADKLEREYRKEKKRIDSFKEQKDYNQFLFDELDKENLQEDEQAELESRLKVLENAEQIQSNLATAFNQLDASEFSTTKSLHQSTEALRSLQSYDTRFKELYERLNSALIEVQDISKELEIESSNFEFNPEEINQVQDRLNTIYRLEKKHSVDSIKELISLKTKIESELLQLADSDEYLKSLEQKLKAALKEQEKKASTLTKKRLSVTDQLANSLSELLSELGMPNAQITIQHNYKEPDESGVDEFDILFTANKGVEPQALRKVASGGEFSRLMFAIKHIMADKVAMPTIIFDEIDTGISGEIALKMVKMMRSMASNHQVISISHLPQIAAKGHHHYFVYKDDSSDLSVSKIKLLKEKERIMEIAKMIGGDNPTDSAINSARELLKV